MTVFDPLQLTGRARNHVTELPKRGPTLHPDAATAFLALRAAAAAEGFDLLAVSSFRDFARQRAIWNGKFRGERPLLDRTGRSLDPAALSPLQRVRAILEWSALPGASRHHWGTDLDVVDAAALAPDAAPQLLPAQFGPGGPFAPLDRWLAGHAGRFGFFRPYDRDRGGVQPEPWHLSYAPLAQAALAALTLPVLADALAEAQRQPDTSLEGYEVVEPLLPELHARYVMAVAAPDEALSPSAKNRN